MIWLIGILAIVALQFVIIFLTIFYWVARIILFIVCVSYAFVMAVFRLLLTRQARTVYTEDTSTK